MAWGCTRHSKVHEQRVAVSLQTRLAPSGASWAQPVRPLIGPSRAGRGGAGRTESPTRSPRVPAFETHRIASHRSVQRSLQNKHTAWSAGLVRLVWLPPLLLPLLPLCCPLRGHDGPVGDSSGVAAELRAGQRLAVALRPLAMHIHDLTPRGAQPHPNRRPSKSLALHARK